MNELDRMKKLAGILTESVMAVPGIGNEAGMQPQMDEAAPDLSLEIQSAIEMLDELEANGVSPEEAVNSIENSFREDGFSDEDIVGVLAAVQQHIENPPGEDYDDTCPSCSGTGEGQYDGASCSSCGGSGQLRGQGDPDDFNEPDEYDPADDWAGDLEEGIPQQQSKLDDALDSLIRVMNSGAADAESEAKWIAKTHNVPAEALAHAYAQYKAQEIGRSGMMEEIEEEADGEEKVEEAFDLNNGYDDINFMAPGDFFPDGADSPVTSHVGPSGSRQGDNPEQKKMEVAEAHKELVYNYRKFLKESAKK